MKAATLRQNIVGYVACISIHAAREGGDYTMLFLCNIMAISIHAAREGGDNIVPPYGNKTIISIHAAREGGDV